MSEEELPDELDKLEITPAAATKLEKMNSIQTTNLNPFHPDVTSTACVTTSAEAQSLLETQHVGCMNQRIRRTRRQSDSVLDICKSKASSLKESDSRDIKVSNYYSASRLGSSFGIQKQQLKKSVTPPHLHGGRRFVLRAPILRALQVCISHTTTASGARRRQTESFGGVNDNAGCRNPDKVNINHSMSDSNEKLLSRKVDNISRTASDSTDFRDLIDECQKLIDEEVDFGRHRKNRHSSKSFTTMRTKCSDIKHNQTTTTTNILPSFCCNRISNTSSSAMAFNFSTNEQPQSNIMTSQIRSASSSCSQQAGNGAAAAATIEDDMVNMNELAGYFEAIVHIPKKMSSMAEMMYI